MGRRKGTSWQRGQTIEYDIKVEQALIRRLNWKIVAWGWIAYLCLNADTSSLVQAQADKFLKDLHMNTNGVIPLTMFAIDSALIRYLDYNFGNTVYRIGFLCAEIPSQLMSKKIGPDRWITILMISWSIVSLSQFWLAGRSSFLACRAIIGLLQGGFIPDLILYLS